MEYEDIICLKQMVEAEQFLEDNGIKVNQDYLLKCVEYIVDNYGSQDILAEWIILNYLIVYYPKQDDALVTKGYRLIKNMGTIIEDELYLYMESCAEAFDTSFENVYILCTS